jgi:hypothetical protein
MDGNTIELDPRTAEAMRQEKVYQQAMASLELQKRKKEAMGYAVMASAYGFKNASQKGTKLGRLVNLSKLLLVALGGGIINYLFYVFAFNG